MEQKEMKRPKETDDLSPNRLETVQNLREKAKRIKDKALPGINGMGASGQAAYHRGRPLPSDTYPADDSDLTRDHLENDIRAAGWKDL